MFTSNKKEFLLILGSVLQKKGFKVILKDKSIINDSYLALTVIDKNRYVQIKLKSKWFKIFGDYSISLMTSDIDFLTEIEKANIEAHLFKLEKKKLYEAMISIISTLKKNIPKAEIPISDLKSNPHYKDSLLFYEFILPSFGVEVINKKVTPLYGIALGGIRAGGIILCNPITKKLILDSYIGCLVLK